MLGSVVVWLFGTLICTNFLVWIISSPEAGPSPETSPTAVVVAVLIVALDVLLCITAAKPFGAATVRLAVIAVGVLALVGLAFRAPDAAGSPSVGFVVLSFLVPALSYALVLPVAIIGRADPRAAAVAMLGVAVVFLVALVVQSVGAAGMWIGFADLAGAFWTAVLAALFLGAQAARERTASSPPSLPGAMPAGRT